MKVLPMAKPVLVAFALLSTSLGVSSLGMGSGSRAAAQSSVDLDCSQPITQLDINICSAREYDRADQQLNRVYRQQLNRLNGSDRDRLIDAELAWIKFRDAECKFRADKYEGGSIRPTIYSSCMAELTEKRIAELQNPYSIDETYRNADRSLNRSFQFVKRNTSERMLDRLIDAQLAWIDYRDANCDFEGQSQITYPLTRQECLARMSAHRSEALYRVEEGDF